MRYLVSAVLCLLIVLGAAGVVYEVSRQEKGNGGVPAETPPTNVEVRIVTPQPMEDLLLVTGNIEPWEDITLSAETTGVIEWQGVDDGETVAKGQELFRVDTTRIQSNHDQAVARKALAEQELERIRDLRESGISSPQQFDRAQTDYQVALADLQATRIMLEKSVVHTPIAGVADAVFAEQGEFVDVGRNLARIVQVDRVKAVVGVPERDIAHFEAGDPVSIEFDAFPNAARTGEIYRIATTAHPASRTFRVEVVLENSDGKLKPGMTLRARLVRDIVGDAIVVPVFAVLSVENQKFVAVEEDGVAHLRPVQTGILRGDKVQLTGGLAPGEKLIVVGQRELREGERVKVTAEAPQ